MKARSIALLAILAQNRTFLRMAQMNISIPDQLKSWAEARVAEGRHSSTSDYVRDLIRRDQEGEDARLRLQAAIDEGRSSGPSGRTVQEIVRDARKLRGR